MAWTAPKTVLSRRQVPLDDSFSFDLVDWRHQHGDVIVCSNEAAFGVEAEPGALLDFRHGAVEL
jgi:hypothetical protein